MRLNIVVFYVFLRFLKPFFLSASSVWAYFWWFLLICLLTVWNRGLAIIVILTIIVIFKNEILISWKNYTWLYNVNVSAPLKVFSVSSYVYRLSLHLPPDIYIYIFCKFSIDIAIISLSYHDHRVVKIWYSDSLKPDIILFFLLFFKLN